MILAIALVIVWVTLMYLSLFPPNFLLRAYDYLFLTKKEK